MMLINIENLKCVTYQNLPGWRLDKGENLSKALLRTVPGEFLPINLLDKIRQIFSINDIYDFIEQFFNPYSYKENGLFTGYYEPVMNARTIPDEEFRFPFYRQPNDLIFIPELGEFREDLKGKRLGGRLQGNTLVPYWTRAEIYQNILKGKNLEIAWVNSRVDAFFADVQGSVCLNFMGGSEKRLHYKATNGHAYRSIGKYMIEKGFLNKNIISMQSIKAYIQEHPDMEEEILCHNPSFVFFEEVKADAPIGTLGCELTATRSLAVDTQCIPLGSLMLLDCPIHKSIPAPRLMLAQDTGGAIKGKVRGDIFMGTGASAGEIAGKQAATGTYYLFIPKSLDVLHK